jgi:hypothetical protein
VPAAANRARKVAYSCSMRSDHCRSLRVGCSSATCQGIPMNSDRAPARRGSSGAYRPSPRSLLVRGLFGGRRGLTAEATSAAFERTSSFEGDSPLPGPRRTAERVMARTMSAPRSTRRMRSQRNVERGHNRLIHCYDTHAATTAESRHINSHSAARAHEPNQRICVAFHST